MCSDIERSWGRWVAWNPWQALREREHIELGMVDDLPERTGGGVYAREGNLAVILIDSRMHRRDRNAVLAHELIHDEREGGCRSAAMPDTWHPIVVRDENTVNREVARRLVPPADLEEFIQGMCDIHLGVGIDEVTEYFDVPRWVARIALDLHEQSDG